MKKVSVLVVAVLLSGILASACIVAPYPQKRARATFRISYTVRAGARVYIVPVRVKPGDIVIIEGKRCVVRKIGRNRIKVVYPNGVSVWIRVEFR